MDEQFPTSDEMLYAFSLIEKNEKDLNVQDRMLFSMFRKIYISEQKGLVSHMLERAQIYNTTIVVAGYASFFAAWQFFKSDYGAESAWYDVSLLIMMLSVLIFVTWNIFTSILLGKDLFQKVETISRNLHDPVYLFSALQSLDQELSKRALLRKKIWIVSLFFSIIPAVLSAAIFFFIVGSGVAVALT